MIKSLHIQNFKSIKDLKLDCARVNLFIGEPNTGKSNILESFGIMTMVREETKKGNINGIKKYVRAEEMRNLFYNKIVDNTIVIRIDDDLENFVQTIHYDFKNFEIVCSDLKNNRKIMDAYVNNEMKNINDESYTWHLAPHIRFYRFKELAEFPSKNFDILEPPNGDNLLSIINSRQEIKNFVIQLFSKYGYRYQGFEDLNKIYFNIDFKGELIPLPYHLLSDTLQRIIFYYTAIELSKGASLLFEEPESHMFPFYNEQLALMIADNSNQFFIATHNPYFLNMLINKTKAEDLRIFKVTYKDYQTFAKPIDKKVLQEFVINDNDILLNIDRLGEDE